MEWKPYLRKAQFYETDSMGVVYHGNYIHWMEEARTDFLEQIGWGYERATAAGDRLRPHRTSPAPTKRPPSLDRPWPLR